MTQFSAYYIRSDKVSEETTLAAVFSKNTVDYQYIERLFGEPKRIESWEAVFQEKDLAQRIANLEKQGAEVSQLERDALSEL